MASSQPVSDVLLWENGSPQSSYMWDFLQLINHKYGQSLANYQDLYQWSIANIADFWGETWHFTGMIATPYKHVLPEKHQIFPRPKFFEGSGLNFAQNLLYPHSNPDPNSPAIISVTETKTQEITWDQLRQQVRECATAMQSQGLQPTDRVAGFLGNHSNTVVAMLAATSLGAIWTGISADTGVKAVLDKLEQIKPVMLFADNAVESHGKIHESATKTKEIIKGLPSLKHVVVFKTVDEPVDLTGYDVTNGKAMTYEDFLAGAVGNADQFEFKNFPPDHPTYILFSSGTTGKPKCIVHSAGGTLIQHKKEHMLQCDIRPGDRMFYMTTCSWMMWHWLVSALASSATIVLYQGSPLKPYSNLSMPSLLSRLRITHYGTSAAFLSILEQAGCTPLSPEHNLNLSSLRAIYSTGSPLAPSTFDYVYASFPPTLNLASITGGTDIISLFGAPSPLLPVYRGEIQGPGLGMAVCAVDSLSGTVLTNGEPGDLVCTQPFPSQPVGFWATENDPAADIEEIPSPLPDLPPIRYNKTKYHASYFATFPNLWHHGDFISINPRTGGLTMLGRSDGVLNPSGIRFGSSEIYNCLLAHFPDSIEDALCVGRRRKEDSDETVVLFVKMKKDNNNNNNGVPFDESLRLQIQKAIARDLSARHVPAVVEECFEIPKTTNDKKVEIVVKKILCGSETQVSASVANPGCLDWYREWARTH